MSRTADFRSKIQEIYSLEQLSAGHTSVHRLHPFPKLVSALTFIVTVVSFNRYAFGRLVPFIFYPVVLMAVAEIPYSLLLKRFLVAVPFIIFVGVSNLVLERSVAFRVGGLAVSVGAVGFFTLLYRTYLCVMAVLILVATTSLADLTSELGHLHVPAILIVMFEMTYRYIGVLTDEVSSMRTAHALRSRGHGVDMRHAGSFVGSLLIRSFNRAERIYAAMKCRGYSRERTVKAQQYGRLKPSDVLYGAAVCVLCVAFRVYDVGAWFVSWLGGIL